jgi:ribonuclease D
MPDTTRTPFKVIDHPEQLDIALREMPGSDAIALDTESNSLHRYPEQLCLIQVATLQKIYIIDTITLRAITPIKEIFEDGSVIKVIHGADYDVRSLDRYGGLRIHNLYDTYIAARFAGVSKFGLADLLRDLLGVDIPKSKDLQHADWGRRPLSHDALEYAAADVRHLLALKQVLDQRLCALGRMDWVLEECSRIENVRYAPLNLETAYLSIKGAQHLDGRALAVLKDLFLFRESEAQRQHRPPFFIIPDVALIYLSNNPSANLNEVPGLGQSVERIGPGVRQALLEGQGAEPVERPHVAYESLNPGQMRLLSCLKVWRESLGQSLCLDPSLLWPTPSLERLAKAPGLFAAELNSSNIRAWQRLQFAASLESYLQTQIKK